MGAEEIAGKLAVTCLIAAVIMAICISEAGLKEEHPVFLLATLCVWVGFFSGIAWIWL